MASVSEPNQSYAYADQAWAMSDAFGDSPPDYAFADDGVTPWVWTASNHAIRIAEAVAGGERYYYYQPGSDHPFYVQDPDYGYAYQGGALVGVYDRSGHSVPVAGHADIAGRYLARAEMLRRRATSAPHQAVAADNWNAQRGYVAAQRTTFSSEAAANPGLNAYHAQHAAQEQAQWAPESARRSSWAAATDARLGHPADAERERAPAPAAAAHAAPPPLAMPTAPRAASPAARDPDHTSWPAAPPLDHRPPAAAPERIRGLEAAAARPRPPHTQAMAPRPRPEAARAPPAGGHRAPERAAPAPIHAAPAHPAPVHAAPTRPPARPPARAPDDRRP